VPSRARTCLCTCQHATSHKYILSVHVRTRGQHLPSRLHVNELPVDLATRVAGFLRRRVVEDVLMTCMWLADGGRLREDIHAGQPPSAHGLDEDVY